VGRKAVGLALALATWTRELVICTNGHDPDLTEPLLAQLDALNIPVLVSRVQRAVHEDRTLKALELEDGAILDCERLFFAIGRFPADDLAQRLGCKRNDEECVLIDEHFHTSVPNVYAAGDLVPGTQIALAAKRAERVRGGRSGAWNADSAGRRGGRREGRDRDPPLPSGTGISYHASDAKHYSFLE
jgi:thioredoxin reductase